MRSTHQNTLYPRPPFHVSAAEVVDFIADPPAHKPPVWSQVYRLAWLRPPLRGSPPRLRASLFANLRFALRLGSTTLACRLTPPQKTDPATHEYSAEDELPGNMYVPRK